MVWFRFSLLLVLISATSCSLNFYGRDSFRSVDSEEQNVIAGAAVFEKQACFACHTVNYPGLSQPFISAPLALQRGPHNRRRDLTAKILSPQHVFKSQVTGAQGSYAEALSADDLKLLLHFLRSSNSTGANSDRTGAADPISPEVLSAKQ